MNPTPLFIDLDDTLFDTIRLKKEIFAMLASLGFSPEAVQAAYAEEREKWPVTPERHLGALLRKHGLPEDHSEYQEKFREAWDILQKRLPEFVYPESEPFLEKIDRSRYQPILLSYGEPALQEKKMAAGNFHRYFDAIHYPPGNKGEYLREHFPTLDHLVFIDDKEHNHHAVRQHFPKVQTYSSLNDAATDLLN